MHSKHANTSVLKLTDDINMNVVLETFAVVVHVILFNLQAFFRLWFPPKPKSVEGEICLITGAGSGIGRQLAIEFARRNATVILWDINDEGNQETAKIINEEGGKAYADHCDVSNVNDIKTAAEKIGKYTSGGHVTFLVNNAGILFNKNILDLTEREIRKTFGVNILGYFWTIKEFMPHMLDMDHGHIVNVASIAGLCGGAGSPDYDSTKHAVVGLDKALRFELLRRKCKGIKLTTICPTFVETGLNQGSKLRFPSILPNMETPDVVNLMMAGILENKTLMCVPGRIYSSAILQDIMSTKANLAIFKFVGGPTNNEGFIPTRDYQIEAHTNMK